MAKVGIPSAPTRPPRKGPNCKGMRVFGQNPILQRFGKTRDLAARAAGLVALRALKKKDLRGGELADALTQFAQQAGFIRGEIEVQHLRNDWLGSWFPKSPVAEIFLDSFIQAAQLALSDKARPLPIEAYWAVSFDDQVSAAIARSEHQVTVVLFTPVPEKQPRVRPLSKKDPVWVISGTRRKITISQNPMTSLDLQAPGARAKPRRGRA